MSLIESVKRATAALAIAALALFWAGVVISVFIGSPVSAPVALAWGVETVAVVVTWVKS